MEEIILFGAGQRCIEAVRQLAEKYEICFIVDNNINKRGKNIGGIAIVGPEGLCLHADKKIVITPVDYNDIVSQLAEMGMENLYVYDKYNLIKKVWTNKIMKKHLARHEFCLAKFLQMVTNSDALELDNVCFKSGGSSVLDYIFIKGIMQYFKLHTYLEIGTYIGESINNVSAIAEKCYSITVPCEHPASMKKFCEKYGMVDFSNKLVNQPNIIQYLVDSKEFNFNTIEENIDVYFIDGDHSLAGIENDTRKVFAHKEENSFVIWHDVKKEGHQINEVTIDAIYRIIGIEGLKNFYICDMNRCGIYVPNGFCELFDSLCNYSREILYTYKLSLDIKEI